ncbi:MAG: hypothetical protein H0X30_13485 [Anaerolineae bacterium]|nr:hypothetical protein [Anaerolineae bacterium]
MLSDTEFAILIQNGMLLANRFFLAGDLHFSPLCHAMATSDFGADGILRVGLADQILGLDWKTFARNCA